MTASSNKVSKNHIRRVLNARIYAVQCSQFIIQKDAVLRELHWLKKELCKEELE